MWTEKYFFSPLRGRDQADYLMFENRLERFRNELYIVVRVLQEVMLRNCERNDKKIATLFNDDQDMLIHRKIMEFLEENYMQELTENAGFRALFLFVRDRVLQENETYNEADVLQVVSGLPEKAWTESNGIIESLRLEKVERFVNEQKQGTKFDRHIGLDQHVRLKCAFLETHCLVLENF
jgi:hypothetical protein